MKIILKLLVISLSLAFAQEAVNPIVVEVGNRKFSEVDFNERFNFFISDMAARQNIPVPLSDETKAKLAELKPVFLEQFLTEQVVINTAKERGISLPEGFVENQLNDLKAQFPDEEAYKKGILDAGIPSEDFLKNLIMEAEYSRQMVEQLRADIDIPDWRVELFYGTHQEAFKKPQESCAKHILVKTIEEANDLEKQLADGASFEDLAKEHSLDPGSGAQGGDLGCFPEGVMVPSFNEVAFSADVGAISEPVESQFGFHIIQVYRRNEAGLIPLEKVKEEVKSQLENEILLKVVKAYQESTPITVNKDIIFGNDKEPEVTEGN